LSDEKENTIPDNVTPLFRVQEDITYPGCEPVSLWETWRALAMSDMCAARSRKREEEQLEKVMSKDFPLEVRLDAMYQDPEFGWFTKRATATTKELGRRYSLSTSTVWDHMQKWKIKTSKRSYKPRPVSAKSLGGRFRLQRIFLSWGRPSGLDEHLQELKRAKKGF
jgi:hypothetical protein